MHFSVAYLLLGLSALLGFAEASPLRKHATRERRFKRFNLYAQFVAASGFGECPNPPNGAHQLQYINNPSTDTQAAVFADDRRKEIIIAFPGSASSQDWDTDMNIAQVSYPCPGCNVHGGFYGAWNSISGQAHQAMNQALQAHPGYKIITVGYSLGAALSTFAWDSFKREGLPVHAAYNYGQPRLGNKQFARHIDRRSGAGDHSTGGYFRIIHNADPVPNWPNANDGYNMWRHPLTQYWEAGETVQSAQTTWRCYGQEPKACALSMQLSAPNGNDHLVYSNVDFTNPVGICY